MVPSERLTQLRAQSVNSDPADLSPSDRPAAAPTIVPAEVTVRCPYRRVVTALDGSPQAFAAFPLVLGLARRLGGSVCLIRAVNDEDEFGAAEKALRGAASELLKQDMQVSQRVAVGRAPRVIESEMQAGDLLVLGLRARATLGEVPRYLLSRPSAGLILKRAGGRRVMEISRVSRTLPSPLPPVVQSFVRCLGHPPDLIPSWADCSSQEGELSDLVLATRADAARLILDPSCTAPLFACPES